MDVSVIIPVFDRAYCIADAVNSVLAQTHRPIECIVIDDGSTDSSYEVVAEIALRHPEVRVFQTDHAGVSAARNRGLREASGTAVTFLDSDDTMTPNRVERQLVLRAERSCDGVIARASAVPMSGASLPTWFERRPEWANEYYWTSLLIDLAPVRAIDGFDETLVIGEDIDLLVRLRAQGLRIDAIDETLTIRRYFGDNLTYAIAEGDSALRDAVRRHIARRRMAEPK